MSGDQEQLAFDARYGDWFAGVWLALVSLTCVGMFVTKRKST